MSTLAVNTITNAAGGNTATINGMTPTAQSLQGFRNRIINGNMVIDQRNAGASITPTDGQYSVDRWRCGITAASKFSVQQNAGAVTPPAGFTNYLGVTSLSAYSVGANDTFDVDQNIEGLNVSDLGWGTASAAAVTLSFWVRSSLTGTFGGVLMNNGFNRRYVFSYTIAAANTWEYKTITVPGDTSGTWLTTNGVGVRVIMALGAGTNNLATAGSWGSAFAVGPTGMTNVVATNGATFYITGVQLEAGSVATPFERRDYGRELMMCQRYLPAFGGTGLTALGYTYNSSQNNLFLFTFPVTTRVAPTGISISSAAHFSCINGSNAGQSPSTIAANNLGVSNASVTTNNSSGFTVAQPSRLESLNSSALILFTGCEL
jgi:hypothetical protein